MGIVTVPHFAESVRKGKGGKDCVVEQERKCGNVGLTACVVVSGGNIIRIACCTSSENFALQACWRAHGQFRSKISVHMPIRVSMRMTALTIG